MKPSPAISIRGISKRYRIGVADQPSYSRVGDALKSMITSPIKALRGGGPLNENNSFWALKDVSFDVQPGEVVGIIGRNGAGKSTLLKVLSQITSPTEGDVLIRGRVGSLLEVGTGFHPELTGRENIFMNGSILGMTQAEIRSKFDEIVDFSEVEKFLDTPVKQYSSGMYTRLAFAVAAHLEPEILIVDEVLSVGDAAFQRKCLGKMKDVAGQGRTVLFVSHNMDAVGRLCDTGVLLEHGKITIHGTVDQVLRQYLAKKLPGQSQDVAKLPRLVSKSDVPLLNAVEVASDDSGDATLPCGGGVRFRLKFKGLANLKGAGIAVIITTDLRERVTLFHTLYHSDLLLEDPSDEQWVELFVPSLPLTPGHYEVDVAIGIRDRDMQEYVESVAVMEVRFGDYLGTGQLPASHQGHAVFPADWRVLADQAEPELGLA